MKATVTAESEAPHNAEALHKDGDEPPILEAAIAPEQLYNEFGGPMSSEPQWLMRIEGALSAHFIQPDGSSRPGTDWSVGLKHGESVYNVMVRSYFSEDMTKRARSDTEYQGSTVLGYIGDLLAQGWTPDQGGDLVIVIQNPTGETDIKPGKPWWKFW